ncbi:hypothetical protein TcasGA2_TC032142 [Tribolium castaneum]|uniref:Uncharacterized protein n=1 Tax=Tribolium castaneum TaxID=7070 RepID=A0A139WMQ3_TRICA|nr:hypothetical protein TcasGA2_TC032142 [Tribolium castaneum]
MKPRFPDYSIAKHPANQSAEKNIPASTSCTWRVDRSFVHEKVP